MLIQETLQPDQEIRRQVDGKFLIVVNTAGPLEVRAGNKIAVNMDINDRLHLKDQDSGKIEHSISIKNISGGVNDIEILTSELLIDKRTSADLANAVISIAQGERVGIDPNANIVQAVITNAIQIAANQLTGIDPKANIVQLDQAINIADDQLVGIDPVANSVQVTNAIELKGKPKVGIDPACNHVKIKQHQTKYKPLEKIEFDDDDEKITVDENSKRIKLILRAGLDNKKLVWLSDDEDKGIPLEPGERIELSTGKSVTLRGDEDDIVYLAEMVKV